MTLTQTGINLLILLKVNSRLAFPLKKLAGTNQQNA